MVTDRPIRFYILLWIGLALGIAAMVAAKPAYRWYAHRRALQIVAEVNAKDFPAGDWDSVGRKLSVAHGLNAQAPEVLRLAARFLSVGGSEGAIQYYAMLESTGKATIADRVEYARQALLHNRPDLSRAQVRRILTESPLNQEALMLGIEALQRLGKMPDALKLAEAALQAHPTSEEATLRLGLLQLAEVDPTKHAAGRRLLWELAVSHGPFNTLAVERLAAESKLAPAEMISLIKTLEGVTNRNVAQDLIYYDLKYRLAPTNDRSALAGLVVQRLGVEPRIEDRIQAADWLLAHDAPKRVSEVLDEAMCRQHEAAAQRWIQARANSGDWAEVTGMIDDQTLALSPETRHCYRALLENRAGNTNGVASHLKLALKSLGDNPNQVYLVADYAEKLRQPKLAAAAYDKLLPYPVHAARAAREILRLLAPSDDVQTILTTLRRLLEFQTDNPEIADAISWWELITRQRVEENTKLALERSSASPNHERFRLTLALAHLRQNNPDSALSLLENRYPDRTNMPARARMLYVAALGASGQRQTAERLAAVLNVASMKPEELELIRAWRGDLNR